MLFLANLAQGKTLTISSSVFASGTIEAEMFVAKHFSAIVDDGDGFVINRLVIWVFTINASPIPFISLLLGLIALVTQRLVHQP